MIHLLTQILSTYFFLGAEETALTKIKNSSLRGLVLVKGDIQ